jgi:hypothetical protein
MGLYLEPDESHHTHFIKLETLIFFSLDILQSLLH